MLSKKIIASSISNLTDARYFAAWGVHAMGFNLNINDVAHISPMSLSAFRDWISGPLILGEFSGMQSKQEILALIEQLKLDGIQLGPFVNPDWQFNVPVFKEVLIEQDWIGRKNETIIVKSEDSSFKWQNYEEVLIKICADNNCFLDLPLLQQDYEAIIEKCCPEGFVLRGGEEEKVGFKSFDEIDLILELLEVE